MGIVKKVDNEWHILKMDSPNFISKGSIYFFNLKNFIKDEQTAKIEIIRNKKILKKSLKNFSFLINEEKKGSLNVGYDYSFIKNNSDLYCTELVYKVYPEIFSLKKKHYTFNVLCENNIIKNKIKVIDIWKR